MMCSKIGLGTATAVAAVVAGNGSVVITLCTSSLLGVHAVGWATRLPKWCRTIATVPNS